MPGELDRRSQSLSYSPYRVNIFWDTCRNEVFFTLKIFGFNYQFLFCMGCAMDSPMGIRAIMDQFLFREKTTVIGHESAQFLPELENLTARAGELIMAHYGSSLMVTTKPDGSPVTDVDHISEEMITLALSYLMPGVPVVGEEAISTGREAPPDISGGKFWLVDALDGTKEFLAGGQDFTVNIALVENAVPVLGVIYHPVSQMIYVGAGEGTAARVYPDGTRQPIEASLTETSFRIVSSKSFGNEIQLAKYLAGRQIHEHRHRASSIKFCEVAEGRADLYPRFGPSREWDTAAGHAIVESAGGSVTTSAGQPLLYGKEGFQNSDFVVRGRR